MRTGKKDTEIFGVSATCPLGGDKGALTASSKGWKRLTAAVCAGLMAGAFSFLPVAEARGGELLPQGGVSSTASIVTDSGTMNIKGAANNVIKWVSFSIGQDNAVKFDNNNYLNYVTGHARSEIMGTLTGGGHIYLVNPNGILIGDNARIDVGSLYLSTRNLTADQLTDYATATGALFKAGNLNGDVINMGKLNADVITVEGNNITFKNVADVTKGGTLANGNITGGTLNNAVTLTANGGEIHLGYENEAVATEVNFDQYKTKNEPTLAGWNFGGKTPAYYMLVRNKYELQNMQNNLSGNYMLANDIDMSGVTFAPIGGANYFEGNFNGLNHEIRNLRIEDNTANDVGLFGVNSGTIRNVGLVGGSIIGSSNVGSIAGRNERGTIENVFNTGTVNAVSGSGTVGGIVGRNYLGTIKNAYNTGAVTSTTTNNWVGGIAGENFGGTIRNVFNTGAITGEGTNNWIGGIVGMNDSAMIHDEPQPGDSPNDQLVNGTITNAYNTGTVTSNSGTNNWVGGIAGMNDVPPSPEPVETYNITNVYNTGTVSGTGTSVWVDDIVGNGGGFINAYTSASGDLKTAATFEGFDFSEDGDWRIYEGNTMPLLTAFLTTKDRIVSEQESDGTTPAGATYSPFDETGGVNISQIGENAINYVSDVAIVTPKSDGNDNPGGGNDNPGGGNDTPSGGNDTPSGGNDTPSGGNNTPGGGNDTPSGGNDTPSGNTTPTNLVNPTNPVEPVNPVAPAPVNPAEPTPAKPGNSDKPVIAPVSENHQQEGNFAERIVTEAESGHISANTVQEYENAAETAKEQPFAKDMVAVAEMGAVEAKTPSPVAPSDSAHSYTMLDGGLVAVRDDVNSAPASAAMGGKSNNNANEVIEAAEQADLTIGTEEVHNRQDNSTSDEDSDQQEKKNNKSKQNTKKTETAKEATDK